MDRWTRRLALSLLAWLFAAKAFAQTSPAIVHRGFDCFWVDRFPVIDAAIDGNDELRVAKVYFRAEPFEDFYYVEMKVIDGVFIGVLPKPEDETQRIVYYIEALDVAFNVARNGEHEPEIRRDCTLREGAAYVPGDDPEILIGATNPHGPAMPPGFEVAGVAGAITAAGTATGIGSSLGLGTAVVGGGVAGAAAAVAVAVSGGDEGPAPVPVPPGDPTPPGGGTTGSGGGGASPSPPPPTSDPPTTPPVVPPVDPTLPPVPSPLDPLKACFTYVGRIGACTHSWDASCSSGLPAAYEWTVDATGELPAGPQSFSTPVVIVNWLLVGGCSGQPITVRLTVRDLENGTDTTSQSGFVIN